MKAKKFIQLRQGDVQIQQVSSLPAGCKEIPPEGGRIVLAHGEVTGHAHAIYDHQPALSVDALKRIGALDAEDHAQAIAAEIADATIARVKARLLVAPNGERYLEVNEKVTLRHEEHTQHTIPPGIYHLPVQVEYQPVELRRVAD